MITSSNVDVYTQVMKSSFWLLLEIIVVGVLLVQSMVIPCSLLSLSLSVSLFICFSRRVVSKIRVFSLLLAVFFCFSGFSLPSNRERPQAGLSGWTWSVFLAPFHRQVPEMCVRRRTSPPGCQGFTVGRTDARKMSESAHL